MDPAGKIDNIKKNQRSIAEMIKDDIEKSPPQYKEMLKYTLVSGKRLRSIITYSISNNPHYSIFVEYLYTAENIRYDIAHSIKQRRGKDSVYIKYGLEIARNIRETLLSRAYYHLNLSDLKNFELDTISLYLDFTESLFKNMETSEREQKQYAIEISRVKSGNIFTLSFILGVINENSKDNYSLREKLEEIKILGFKFGLCYQIIKDLAVQEISDSLNIVKHFSHNEIIDIFSENMQYVVKSLLRLNMLNPTIREITTYMAKKFSENFKALKH